MQKNREIVQRSESFPIGVLLALTGGFLDAYTYVSRGGVFANARLETWFCWESGCPRVRGGRRPTILCPLWHLLPVYCWLS